MTLDLSSSTVKPGQLYEVLPDGRWAFYFDHHLISTFSTCGMKFKYKHMDHLGVKGVKPFAMSIGSWWSDVMSDFYEAIAKMQQDPSRMVSREWTVEMALTHWKKLAMDGHAFVHASQYTKFDGKDGAVNMIRQYYDANFRLDLNNWKIIATESGFGRKKEVLVGESDKVIVYLIGKPDILLMEQNRISPLDHKTIDVVKGDEILKYKPHHQTIGYCLGAEVIAKSIGWDKKVDRCIINICARTGPPKRPTTNKPFVRFKRVYPNYSPEEFTEYRRQKVWQAEALRKSIENDSWTMNDTACHIFDGCEFREICSKPPGARQIVIQSRYTKKEPWVPYETEEEQKAKKNVKDPTSPTPAGDRKLG